MKTLIVTGGAGFIGSNFVRLALRETGSRVVVFDKLTYAGSLANLREIENDPRFVFERGDIADREAVARLFGRYRPTGLVNFAAESHVDRSIDGPSAFVQTNIVGTFELLEATRGLLSELDSTQRAAFRFLHVSTDEVYGSLGPEGAFCESTPYAPNSPYAASKASADHLVRAYHETFGVPTLITNCSNNYGPYQFPEKLLPLMLLNALEGKPLPVYGDGLNVRDWIYVEDHCRGVLRVLERGAPGEKYNIGANCERTNLEVLKALLDSLERFRPARENARFSERGIARYEDLKVFVKDRPGHDRRYAIDSSKIRDELQWRPLREFEAGMEETVRWYLDHLDWCREVQEGRYERKRLGLGDKPSGRDSS
jgi:dTDP-glucose 4,6-dehydratase